MNLQSEVSPSEWFSLSQFLHEIRQVDSPCISAYYPYGRGGEMISYIRETRRAPLGDVELKITRRIEYLRKHPQSAGRSVRTLCIFGWVRDGRTVLREIGTSKKLPRMYVAARRPYVKPFRDILKTGHDVLLVVADQKTASIRRFHGGRVTATAKLGMHLQGRHRKGGQSQGRFLRARQTKIHVFLKKVASRVGSMGSGSDIILIGGTDPARKDLHGLLDPGLAAKSRLACLSFSTPEEAVRKRMISHLYLYRKRRVLDLIARYESLVKDGLTARDNRAIGRALSRGAVETLIVSADYHRGAESRSIMRMLEKAESTSAEIEFATNPAVVERLDRHGSVLAILRYRV